MKKLGDVLRGCLAAAMMILCGAVAPQQVGACTSAIVGIQRGAGGRWLLWKHRDSGHPDNYVRRIAATDSTLSYVALFNAADTASLESWIGFNEVGFAVMNTATYNLPAPAQTWQDREGFIMSRALATCRTLDDFRRLLVSYPGKRGVQANFGAIDAEGNGAYFETSDAGVEEFPLDSLTGIATRTNYSFRGTAEPLAGLKRHTSELHQLDSLLLIDRPWAPAGKLGAEDFTEVLSRSFLLPVYLHDKEKNSPKENPGVDAGISAGYFTNPYGQHAYQVCDLLDGQVKTLADNGDVISRHNSSASVVIEGPLPGEDPAKTIVMWTLIGFPALSTVEAVTLDSVPASLLPSPATGRSALADSVAAMRRKAFIPVAGKKRKFRFNLPYLRQAVPAARGRSLPRYAPARSRR